ncbi:hypothetical protein GCM10010195_55390 [Kitasatospora griseola]|nr:hypothetical protein GCM10010195_55390 [Kitasatospora griseola]
MPAGLDSRGTEDFWGLAAGGGERRETVGSEAVDPNTAGSARSTAIPRETLPARHHAGRGPGVELHAPTSATDLAHRAGTTAGPVTLHRAGRFVRHVRAVAAEALPTAAARCGSWDCERGSAVIHADADPTGVSRQAVGARGEPASRPSARWSSHGPRPGPDHAAAATRAPGAAAVRAAPPASRRRTPITARELLDLVVKVAELGFPVGMLAPFRRLGAALQTEAVLPHDTTVTPVRRPRKASEAMNRRTVSFRRETHA